MTTSTDQHPKQATRQLGAEQRQDARQVAVRLTKVVVGERRAVTMIAPLATDMYVPAFPLVGSDLRRHRHRGAAHPHHVLRRDGAGPAHRRARLGPARSTSPVAGRAGRHDAASALCAFSPSIAVMMVARLVQGFSRRVGDGHRPVTGGRPRVRRRGWSGRSTSSRGSPASPRSSARCSARLILQLSHWRMSFWLLAALGAVMLVTVAVAVPESLPAERRHSGGLRQLRGRPAQVLGRAASSATWS